MPNTLTLGGTTVTLPDDLFVWTDELAWSPVVQKTSYSITGALIVDAAVKQAGQQMTLQDGTLARSVLLQLVAWRALPAQTFVLVFNGTTHNVKFDQERNAIDAQPLVEFSDPDTDDLYQVTLRFIKV